MNFKPELLAKILAGEKTQTRRPVQPGQHAVYSLYPGDVDRIVMINQERRGKVYGIFQEYAICPGRGKRHVARFKLLSIREEDVRCISDDDVKAEGFAHRWEFFKVWCGFYDRKALKMHTEISGETVFDIASRFPPDAEAQYLCDWSNALMKRDEKPYIAWALTFELVTTDGVR